jgi:hypothetical protein
MPLGRAGRHVVRVTSDPSQQHDLLGAVSRLLGGVLDGAHPGLRILEVNGGCDGFHDLGLASKQGAVSHGPGHASLLLFEQSEKRKARRQDRLADAPVVGPERSQHVHGGVVALVHEPAYVGDHGVGGWRVVQRTAQVQDDLHVS